MLARRPRVAWCLFRTPQVSWLSPPRKGAPASSPARRTANLNPSLVYRYRYINSGEEEWPQVRYSHCASRRSPQSMPASRGLQNPHAQRYHRVKKRSICAVYCSRAGSSVTASTRGGGFRRTLIATGKHRRPRWGAWRGSRRQAHARHQRRQTLHEFQRRDPDARGLVEPGTLQLQHDVTRRIFLARWDHLNNKVSAKPKAAPTAVSPPTPTRSSTALLNRCHV